MTRVTRSSFKLALEKRSLAAFNRAVSNATGVGGGGGAAAGGGGAAVPVCAWAGTPKQETESDTPRRMRAIFIDVTPDLGRRVYQKNPAVNAICFMFRRPKHGHAPHD